ncbi:TPM domain-containing protein [Arvimicrobium flavum]|uniref:TPM domain-containing protein n=1 Tax=Arvimicrobium flavum TaxID=3393320 RepID=UPI00237C44E4|nr:YgcG family protein [Mesorhizobium shangrilense]
MRKSAACVFAFVLFLLVFPLSAFATELPALTGRVVDDAGMIDPATEAALASRLEAFERKTSIQVVVATVDSLDGEAIEPYANRLFRAWGLGQAGDDNGALLLVAKSDRKMRIEVGYGLEGTLTDLHSKLIIENTMVPAFRQGDFAGGISRAADQIVMVLEGNAGELTPPDYQYEEPGSDIDPVVVIFFIIWGTLFVGGFAMAILPPIFGKKIGPNRYRWLGMDITVGGGGSSSGGGWSSGSSSGGWSSGSSGGGFSGGGGSSGGGGASGSW